MADRNTALCIGIACVDSVVDDNVGFLYGK